MKHRYLISLLISLLILSALTSCGVGDTYKIVIPTEEELNEIETRLSPILSTYFDNYDCFSEDMYNNLFSCNQLKYVCPVYNDEIAKFVDKPLDFPYGNACWSTVVYENDPLGVFGKISEKAYDDNGKVDIDLAYNLLQLGDIIGYNKFSGAYIDWLVEGVWNGKVNHDTAFNFEDGSQCYYHNGYYYTPEKISALGGGIFHNAKVNSISLIEENKYEIKYAVFDENDMQVYLGSAVTALKESKDGFRFWSIYSINVESCNHQEPKKDILPPPVSEQQETTVTDTTVPYELTDLYGESVIEPEKDDYGYIRLSFDSDSTTSGLYPICVWSCEQKRNLYGFINSNGELVVEPKYAVAYASSNGYAVAGLDGIHTNSFGEQIENAYTYINDNGEKCVGIYTKAGTFSENLAVVSDSKFENYIIDNNGTVISKLDSDTVACGVFSSNRLLFYSEKLDRYGYLNEKGEIIIPAVYKNANSFSDGLAAIETESGKLAYIDTDGNTVIETEAEAYSAMFTMFPGEPACDFSEGIAKVENSYIDKTGTKLNIQNGIGMHSNRLIPIFSEDGSQGYSNTDGEVVIPCDYRWARTFMDCGLAMVFSYDKGPQIENAPDNAFGGTALRGFINTIGEIVIPLEYYDRFDAGASHSYPVAYYRCGVIELYKNGYTYYFNTDGVLLGKKPEIYRVVHNGVSYCINLAEYYDLHLFG